MFDARFTEELMNQIAAMFNRSVSPQFLISTRPPKLIINTYHFSVRYLDEEIVVRMSGKTVIALNKQDYNLQ
jgi:hypothetical protein